jgi:hypothetical protein
MTGWLYGRTHEPTNHQSPLDQRRTRRDRRDGRRRPGFRQRARVGVGVIVVVFDSAGAALRIVAFAPHPGWFTVRLEQPSATQLEVQLESASGQVHFSAQLANGAVTTSLDASSVPGSSAPSVSAPSVSAPGGTGPENSAPGNTSPGGGDDDGGGGNDDNSGPG